MSGDGTWPHGVGTDSGGGGRRAKATAAHTDEVVTNGLRAALGRVRCASISCVPPVHLATRAAQHGVAGVILRAGQEGRLEGWSSAHETAIEAAQCEALRASLVAETLAVNASSVLSEVGVRSTVLKGCATANLDHTRRSERTFRDADLLVARADWPSAQEALLRVGLTRVLPSIRHHWELEFEKDIPLRTRSGTELDVHLGLVAGYFGVRCRAQYFHGESESFAIAGHRLVAFDSMGRLMHAAVHSASGTYLALNSALDVITMTDRRQLDLDVFDERARASQVGALIAEGLTRVHAAIELSELDLMRWAHDFRRSPTDRHAISALQSGDGSRVKLTALAAMSAPAKLRYAAPLALPSRRYLKARGMPLRLHLANALVGTSHSSAPTDRDVS